ncbi:cytochrome-c peroxidase [Rhodoferax sp. 4810]|uniref:Cytochrome-c peroxidase n=2 Tax=Thiospirillum jenense TaxID=1653858 RepID=A0A839HJ10_9GAMM|nr:cytochrome-c peroxidase [Rhodoferax jenense]MBB1126012.1 cytochrome-c peroxidase [Thiospirillum jenense]
MTLKSTVLATGIGLWFTTIPSGAAEPIQPLTPPSDVNSAQVELGKKLYFDPRLSKSGFISCNSCHNLSMGGTDNLPTSVGHHWQQGPINSPTVLNSGLSVAQFWDGRAADLKEQAAGPIANPREMAMDHTAAVATLNGIPGYVAEFKTVFNQTPITLDQVTQAIAEFEKTLVTPNSRFDQWLAGNETALTAEERAGYDLFKSVGCVACHNGPAVGGSSFQKVGVIAPYQTTNPAEGRIAVTGKDADRLVFKVPTLRNIALTYPYFHDGAVQSLNDAVNIMAHIQLNRTLTADENAKVVAFLNTLTGDQPNFALPQLPPSVANTPKPEPFAAVDTPAAAH